MVQKPKNNSILYFKGMILSLISYLILGFYGCQETTETDLGPGQGPGSGLDLNDWTYQNSDAFVNFTDVFFVDANTGWIVGEENTLLSTTTGGVTWPIARATVTTTPNHTGFH